MDESKEEESDDEVESQGPNRLSVRLLKDIQDFTPSFFKSIFTKRKQPVKWIILPDPNSPFIKLSKPFFIDHTDCVAARLCGKGFSKRVLGLIKNPLFFALEWLVFCSVLYGAYGVTDLLHDYFTLICVGVSLFRIVHFLLFTNRLLRLIIKEEEFIVLFISSLCGTIGLLDAFSWVSFSKSREHTSYCLF